MIARNLFTFETEIRKNQTSSLVNRAEKIPHELPESFLKSLNLTKITIQ